VTELQYGPALRADYDARCTTWSDIQDWIPTLHDTAARYPGAVVLELGVRSGNSTSAFLLAVDEVRGHLWSADVNTPGVPGWWWSYPRWTCRIGDDCNPAVAVDLPAEVDVLFIDTSHHYEHTLNELRLYVPRVKSGGVVLMHDTELEQPDGYAGGPFPVARALDAYCAEAGLRWENRAGCYGLGVIQL
jgi:predicted O-methyltransferase YrrM